MGVVEVHHEHVFGVVAFVFEFDVLVEGPLAAV